MKLKLLFLLAVLPGIAIPATMQAQGLLDKIRKTVNDAKTIVNETGIRKGNKTNAGDVQINQQQSDDRIMVKAEKVNSEYVFTSKPVKQGLAALPKITQTKFTTSDAVYGAVKIEKPLGQVFKIPPILGEEGFTLYTDLYAGNKKIGTSATFFTTTELTTVKDEKIIPLEIIPGENTWQFHEENANLLEKIADLQPGITNIKIKRYNNGEVVFAEFELDATTIMKDKARLLRIAERIRNNKKNIAEVIRQHEKNIWLLPNAAIHNAKWEAEIKSALKSYLGINANHVILGYADWVVHTHPSGIPDVKQMAVTYSWKDKNGECWLANDKAYRSYLGGGRYSGIKFERYFKDHLVDCENIK